MVEKSEPLRGAVVLVVVAAVVLHAVTDNALVSDFAYLGVLIGASAGAWIGAWRAPPGRRLVPMLIAVGISLSALGDVLWDVLDWVGAETDVSVADIPWIASYGFICVALWVVLSRTRRATGDRIDVDFLVDAATIVVVSVLIFYSLAVYSILYDQSLPMTARLVNSAYPIADAVLIALVVRVLISRSARSVIDASFGVGLGLWLAADVAYLLVPGDRAASVAMDAAWMIAPVLLARAAWQRSVPEPAVTGSSSLGGLTQIVIAVGPLLVPSALELASDLQGEPNHEVRLLVGTGLLIALAFARTARLIRAAERARGELVVARDAALKASDAKSMFLANVSHEIRTPLTTVLAAGEILEDTTLDALQRELLSRMHRSGDLLKRLVEGILDLSRIEAGQLELVSSEYDLHELVADAAELYGPRATEAGLRFDWHLDPCVPRHVVGDPGRLFQVLTNLLENALKFTHEGEVLLVARPAHPATDGRGLHEGVELAVSDTGIGIRAEDQASVFESFSQVDGSMTRRYGGSGLGLAICKELAELMGGCIVLHSQYGAGSTFVVRFPVTRGRREEVSREPVGARVSPGSAPVVQQPRRSPAAGL